ncbi:unnamed protein product [Linum tenue]|uniref:Uncharacterized protein n=1 Tax=Linum tenue TaxID=586396 RepID=A0AAV0RCZ7_9ROSI|nr:unnamed protein product [Linum tenue]
MAFLLPNFSAPLLTANNNPKEKPSTSFQLQSSTGYLPSFAATATAAAGSSASPSPPLLNSSPPPTTNLNHRNNDFYVNLGLAVRTLREDMPTLFVRDLNYDIYRDDITFRDPANVFTGISNYKLLFWALRFHGKLLFKDIAVEVYRIWQPSDNVILIRWNAKGNPRVPWEAKGEFQGTSTYKLDKNGKIYEHKVDNLAFNFPQSLKSAGVSIADLVAACPARVNPTFLLWQAQAEDDVPDSACSWLEFYDAVRGTVVREGYDALLT